MVRKPTSKETARKPNMREAILAAAEELFATNGFNAVSVRDIAQAAGANPGSVTYHFKTKDGLLLEIYRRHCGPMSWPIASASGLMLSGISPAITAVSAGAPPL